MAERVTVVDGGMGRELLRIGAPFRQPEWSALALIDGPHWVVQAHRNFIEAGADVITTNSYALVPFHIGDEMFAARGHELAALSGRLAQQAARSVDRSVQVAGSLPPLFGSYRPDLFDAANAASLIDPLVDGLGNSVDVWLGETLGSVAEAVAVRQALDRAGAGQPLWISYTLSDDPAGVLRSGESVHEALTAAIDLGAEAVLFNCCLAEAITSGINQAIAVAGAATAVGGYANRFVSAHTASDKANGALSGLRDDLDPITYRSIASEWLAAGATIVGGCCGMEPAHIAELAKLAGR